MAQIAPRPSLLFASLLLACVGDGDEPQTSGSESSSSGAPESSATFATFATTDASPGDSSGLPMDSSDGDPMDSSGASPTTTGGPVAPDFDVLCFSEDFDETVLVDVDAPDGPNAYTLHVDFHAWTAVGAPPAAASGDLDFYAITSDPRGSGGVAGYTREQAAEGATPEIAVEHANPAGFRSATIGTAGVVFAGEANGAIVCDLDLSGCTEASAPLPPDLVACSDDGTCLGSSGVSNGTLRSTDGGLTWTQQANDYIAGPIVAAPGGDYVLFDGYNLVMWVSTDGGETFEPTTIPDDAQYVGPLVYSGGRFVGGTVMFQSGGIFHSQDGQTWLETRPQIDDTVDRAVDLGDLGTLAYGTFSGAAYLAESDEDWFPFDVEGLGRTICVYTPPSS